MARTFGRYATRRAPLAGAGPRLASLIAMLIALALIYSQARKPETWRWLVTNPQPSADTGAAEPPPGTSTEIVVAGPTDLDPAEKAEAERLFQAIDDKTDLEAVDMPAYWQLFQWTRAQSFADMEARAKRDVSFADVFQHPEQHRGELIRLELHIRQVVDYAPRGENPLEVSRVYEAWGPTDQSQSHPYCVLFTDLPSGFPTGGRVRTDAIFVGYFLKTMSYLAGDTRRATPVLIGRIRPTVFTAEPYQPTALDGLRPWFLVAGAALIVGIGIWRMRSRASRPKPGPPTAAKEAELAEWANSHAGEEAPAATSPHRDGEP